MSISLATNRTKNLSDIIKFFNTYLDVIKDESSKHIEVQSIPFSIFLNKETNIEIILVDRKEEKFQIEINIPGKSITKKLLNSNQLINDMLFACGINSDLFSSNKEISNDFLEFMNHTNQMPMEITYYYLWH